MLHGYLFRDLGGIAKTRSRIKAFSKSGPEVNIFAFYQGRREKGSGWRSFSLLFLFLFTQFLVANGEEKTQNKTEQFEQR